MYQPPPQNYYPQFWQPQQQPAPQGQQLTPLQQSLQNLVYGNQQTPPPQGNPPPRPMGPQGSQPMYGEPGSGTVISKNDAYQGMYQGGKTASIQNKQADYQKQQQTAQQMQALNAVQAQQNQSFQQLQAQQQQPFPMPAQYQQQPLIQAMQQQQQDPSVGRFPDEEDDSKKKSPLSSILNNPGF